MCKRVDSLPGCRYTCINTQRKEQTLKSRKKIDRQSGNQKPTKSVKGLANIASLIAPVAAAAAPAPAPAKPKALNAEVIVNKTLANLRAVGSGNAEAAQGVEDHNRRIVTAAVREALNLGHAMAVGQNDMIEDLLKKQYAARTELTMPAVVAAVMEQVGMTELLLQLDNVATVFSRCRLEQKMVDEGVMTNTMDYKLRYLADDSEGVGDNSFSLAP